MDWIFKQFVGYLYNIKECNPGGKHKVLIVFDDMITDMISNKKFNQILTGLYITGKKT